MSVLNRVLLCSLLFVQPCFARGAAPDLNHWIDGQSRLSWRKLLKNISPPDGAKGSVIASPSRRDPNYYFHWVRDAALATAPLIETVVSGKAAKTHPLFPLLLDYVRFAEKLQRSHSISGLGEPKFQVDGTPFAGPWGRPQNDGPALRSLYLTRLARKLLRDRDQELARFVSTVIQRDLAYVAAHWRDPSFDLWEEVEGRHFYTLMNERAALLEGADLAYELGDPGSAGAYGAEAANIRDALKPFFQNGIIVATRSRIGGLDYKHSGLDTSVLLAVLHTGKSSLLSMNHPALANTVGALIAHFSGLYPINHRGLPGALLGRYPEDRYFGGNPWILTTLALAEYYYANSDLVRGDEMLQRVRYHARPDGGLSEQFNRDTGFMCSAEELTWSHAAFISAISRRNVAMKSFFRGKRY